MKVLITGGCGFIGTNLALERLARGDQVRVYDNCSRAGTERNRAHLESLGEASLDLVDGDVRDADETIKAAADADVIFHLAAQVAVTASVADPAEDLDVNVRGTFNVLEAVRALPTANRPALLFTSTNKVYGCMEDISVVEQGQRHEYATAPEGIAESQPLDFHSPYGCSKGAADQYVRDYARIYGLRTVVFRMSCIYGPRQWGTEDQGWVAHFLISAALGRPVTIYGDGKQVRDVLYVDDLVEAFLRAVDGIDSVSGEVFNLGGGPRNTISLLELLDWLATRAPRPVATRFDDWRPGDQRVYVSDVRKARTQLGWEPRVAVTAGLEALWGWVNEHRALFPSAPSSQIAERL
jgi:CDP-paratose 2-epimerase